jgi:hypothetical protein
VQLWVPDVRSPLFGQQAHDHAAAVAASDAEADDQTFIDALGDGAWSAARSGPLRLVAEASASRVQW